MPPLSTDELNASIEELTLSLAEREGRVGLADDLDERRRSQGRADRIRFRLNAMRSLLLDRKLGQGLTEEQKGNLFAGVRSRAEAGARSGLGNLASRLGGTGSARFSFLANIATVGAQANAGAQIAQIEIDESRRSQELAVQREQIRAQFSGLDFQRQQGREQSFQADRNQVLQARAQGLAEAQFGLQRSQFQLANFQEETTSSGQFGEISQFAGGTARRNRQRRQQIVAGAGQTTLGGGSFGQFNVPGGLF